MVAGLERRGRLTGYSCYSFPEHHFASLPLAVAALAKFIAYAKAQNKSQTEMEMEMRRARASCPKKGRQQTVETAWAKCKLSINESRHCHSQKTERGRRAGGALPRSASTRRDLASSAWPTNCNFISARWHFICAMPSPSL